MITGASERGIVDALFYEMKYAEDGNDLLDEFISLIELPEYHQDIKVTGASIYFEQSFSECGQVAKA